MSNADIGLRELLVFLLPVAPPDRSTISPTGR